MLVNNNVNNVSYNNVSIINNVNKVMLLIVQRLLSLQLASQELKIGCDRTTRSPTCNEDK